MEKISITFKKKNDIVGKGIIILGISAIIIYSFLTIFILFNDDVHNMVTIPTVFGVFIGIFEIIAGKHLIKKQNLTKK